MAYRKWFLHIPAAEARAAGLSLGIGSALTGVKFAGYFLTGSAVIFSDAVESIVNVVAAAAAIYSLSVAHRPADADHPYGHGKVEFLSAGFEGGMILIAGVVALVKAVDVLRNPAGMLRAENLTTGLLLMGSALVVNGGLGLYLIRTGKRHGSVTLEADGHHVLTDAWTSLAAVAALVVVRMTGWTWVDPVAAVGVSLYIGWVGIGLLRRAEAGLTDRQDERDAKLLESILDAHLPAGEREPRICGYHKVRHRHVGRFHWVEFHLVVPADWDVRRGHEVATAIEGELAAALGEGDATAHVEPCTSGLCGRCGKGKQVRVLSAEC
jgi:cation diffusion facilitator family transporter